MRRSPVVGNLFSGRRALPSAMFTGRALNKRCVPHPVNPVNPENPASEQLIAIRHQTMCLGLQRRVPMLFDTRVRRNSSTGPTPNGAAGNRGMRLGVLTTRVSAQPSKLNSVHLPR